MNCTKNVILKLCILNQLHLIELASSQDYINFFNEINLLNLYLYD